MAQATNSSSLTDTHLIDDLGLSHVAIVATEWNDKIVRELINGCESVLHKFGSNVIDKTIVPGAFELPFACQRIWRHYQDRQIKPEAIIAFGAVIRGGTPHFDYVCKAVTDGIVQLNLSLPVPVIFGVLTLDTDAQAWERLGGIHGHKGEEAALAALKMIKMCRIKP